MDSEKSTSGHRRTSRELPSPACHVVAVLAGMLAAMLLIACATSGVEAAPSRAVHRAQLVCATAVAPGRAECLGSLNERAVSQSPRFGLLHPQPAAEERGWDRRPAVARGGHEAATQR
jgi:hypothetical protein